MNHPPLKIVMIMALWLALIAPSVRADEIDDLRDKISDLQDQLREQQDQAQWDQWQRDWSRRYDERHERHCKPGRKH
jgi:hypothetical protein